MIEEMPLSSQQEAFLSWMNETTELRHPAPVSAAIRIFDEFDPQLLERSLARVTPRHEALRTVFQVRGGRHRAHLLDSCPAEVRWRTVGGLDLDERTAAAHDLACRERERPFDLHYGPLVRALVIELERSDHILLLAIHHLVFDAWSMAVLLRELGLAYSAIRAGLDPSPRRAPPMQCSEVVGWSRSHWPVNRRSWHAALDGAPTALESFPGRKPTSRFTPRSVDFRIDTTLAQKMRKVARENLSTTFMAMLAAWSAVLSSWSGATDIVLMSPVAGRTLPGSEGAIGCLFASLLIRVDLSGQPTFRELLSRVRSASISATKRQDYPYAEFREFFPHAPCLGYYSWKVPLHFPGLESESFDLPAQLVEDLEVTGSNLGVPQLCLFDQENSSITARLAFNEAAFNQRTVKQLAQDFLHFVEHIH